MDAREEINDFAESLETALDGRQSQMWTAIPAIVEEFDAQKGRVTVRPSIKATLRKSDGKLERQELPLIKDAPIQFPNGGGVTMTFPMKKGDEVLAVFSSRSIDQWEQSGGIQQQISARMHDLSDAMILTGFRSQPRKLNNISTTGAQIRSDDGSTHIEVTPDNVNVKTKKKLKAEASDNASLGCTGGRWVHVKGGEVHLAVDSAEGTAIPKVLTDAGPAEKCFCKVD